MLKALFKKQFLELTSVYFQDKKTGKLRSAGKTAGMIILFAFVFFSVGVMFLGIADMLADALIPAGLDWLYFSMMAMMAIAIGVIGSVFSTYSSLYRAKDNELLLSMPIRPSQILLVRISGVYAMSLLFTSLVWLPGAIQYWLSASASTPSVVFSLLLTFVIAAVVTVLACILGWLVALIAGKLKNKSFATVLAYLVFLGAYYFVYFRLNNMLQSLLLHTDELSHTVRTWIYPVYQLGLAACGNTVPLLVSIGIAAVLSALCLLVLSRSFIRIVTANRGAKKTVYKEQSMQLSGTRKALLTRELRHYVSSPTYMMNCGLGLIFLPAAVVVGLIKKPLLTELILRLQEEAPGAAVLLPVLLTGAVCLMLSMNCVSAPSVSLEGSSLWIARSMPVQTKDILHAKLNLHALLNLPITAISVPLLGLVIGADPITILMMLLTAAMFVLLTGRIGLAMDLKHPILVWTNETIPVKQSLSTLITIFGSWGILVLLMGGAFLLRNLEPWSYLLVCTVVLRLLSSLLDRWLAAKGTALFESL